MKKILLLTVLSMILFLCSCNTKSPSNSAIETNADTQKNTTSTTETESVPFPEVSDKKIYNHTNMKAVWLSQFDLQNIYSENKTQRDKNEFETYIDQILDNLEQMGFNTIILQIRPYADSFYPSEVYPPSMYVVGSYSNNFSYDPLPYIIQKSHEKNISVQAWINPLRCMTTDEINQIDNNFKIKQWYDSPSTNEKYVVSYKNRLYLNPAYEEVRDLIVGGVYEILNNYDFDGIHMDDYFYPTTDTSFDKTAYDEYVSKNGNISLKKFRYQSLNSLVSEIYATVKSNSPEKIFGISPAGNINTVTNEAYADVYTWCSSSGYIDYICPQIYFGFEHQTYPFDKTFDKWCSIIKTDSVKLVAGITLGKAFSKEDQWAGSGKNEWKENNDVLKKSVEYAAKNELCMGVSFFSYQYFFNPLTNKPIEQTKEEIDNFLSVMNNLIINNA